RAEVVEQRGTLELQRLGQSAHGDVHAFALQDAHRSPRQFAPLLRFGGSRHLLTNCQITREPLGAIKFLTIRQKIASARVLWSQRVSAPVARRSVERRAARRNKALEAHREPDGAGL